MSKYAGLDASEWRRVKALEAENAMLKRMVAELSVDIGALKVVISRTLEGRPKSARCMC